MVKNKDKLVEKELNTPISKQESIQEAKDTLKAKLDEAANLKKQQEDEQKKKEEKAKNDE